MSSLSSTTRAQGASIVTTVPAEVVRRLGLAPGQGLEWVEDGRGGFRVVPQSAGLEEAMEAHDAIMDEYDAVFRKLAE